MIEHRKMKRVLLLSLGIVSLTVSHALAVTKNPEEPKDFSLKQCQASLKQDSLRLKAYSSQQESQVYNNLYQQIQDFLRNPENLNNPSQSDKCQNFIHAIDSIVGKHPKSKDLAPMPGRRSNSQMGKLTTPTLETGPRRPIAPLSIRYVDALKVPPTSPEEDESESGEINDNELNLTSTSTPVPGTKKTHLKETELE